MPLRHVLGPAALTAILATAPAAALAQQQSTNRVAAETDWSVFVEDDPKECWGMTTPKETVNSRDGQVVSVRRGDIILFVVYRPGTDVAGEVAFTGGYPFAADSTVTLQVGDDSFDLFTEGEWAWPASPQIDDQILTALKTGEEAVVTGESSRGTTTQDTFSLMGITAALDEAESQCTGTGNETSDAAPTN